MKILCEALLLTVAAAIIFTQGCRTARLPDEFHFRDNRSADVQACEGELVLRWLGTAGYEVRKGETTILIDPFISRPSFADVAFGTIIPHKKAIKTAMDEGRLPKRVDYVFVGHSHYDHLLDVGFIAKTTKATVVGSKSTCNILRSRHIPENRLIEVEGGEEIEAGTFKVKIIRSLHVRTRLGGVTYPGEVTGIITRPTRAIDYRVGKVFGFFFQEKETGFTFYHNGSANLIDENLEGLKANLVIMSIAHMKRTKNYVKRLLTPLNPDIVIPTHYDDFCEPFDKGVQLMAGVDIEDFANEVRAVNPDIRILTLDFFQEYRQTTGGKRESEKVRK